MSPLLLQLSQQIVNGLVLGSVYALLALGYTMVYGIIGLINFAHGDLYMIGSYVAFLVFIVLGALATALNLFLVIVVATLAAMAVCAILGVSIERVAYRPLRRRSSVAPLISALGMSIVLENAVLVIAGPNDRVFPNIVPRTLAYNGFTAISWLQVAMVLSAVALMVALQVFVRTTSLGRAMRATSQDRETAGLMGIDVDRVIAITFLIGSALGAASGVMVGIYYGVINFSMGYIAGLKAFTGAVLGGIGNIPGAMLGGFLIGIIESVATAFIPSGAEWKDATAFAILILILVVKPTGLLGQRLSERA
ncbi:MAG: branched-chain amino acid ABC transporter permease [Chloroflexota bacterium]